MDFCRTCFASEFQNCKHIDECDWKGMSSEEYALQLTMKLLPCPFCGGKANEDVFFCGVITPHNYSVKCMHCSLEMHHDRIDKVIGIWNHRSLLF